MSKDINDLKKELSDLFIEGNKSDIKKRELNAIKKRIQFLRTCIMYLETSPATDFLKKEAARIIKRISAIDDSYSGYNTLPGFKGNKRRHYDNEMGVPVLKIQLRTINFLLN